MIGPDFLGGIGWRDIVLVATATIGIYLVLSVMRLIKVAGKRRRAETPPDIFDAARPPHTAAAVSGPEFADELARSAIEGELQSLRRESTHLREELARLAEEISRLKATRHVSPTYNEAMTLAQQGMPAAGIADHCGISIGEAELVAALARSGSEFERHEQGEVRDERNTDDGNRLHG